MDAEAPITTNSTDSVSPAMQVATIARGQAQEVAICVMSTTTSI